MRDAGLITETEPLLLGLEDQRFPGFFVTFEGVEGCGKSTQIKLLAERLTGEGYEFVQTAEPGGTPIGEEIRELLLRAPGGSTITQGVSDVSAVTWGADRSKTASQGEAAVNRQWGGAAISPVTEALLYAASRAEHVEQVIRPALSRGDIVLCDRYVDSTLAYQGGGRELGFEFVLGLHDVATGGLYPDLTILLDIDVSTALRRARRGSGGDRIEQEKLKFHRRVHDSFERIALIYPDRVVTIDASRSKEEIAEQVYTTVAGYLIGRRLA